MRETIRVFIGFDQRETVAYHVLAHSIIRQASMPVSIHPLCLGALTQCGLYWRPRHLQQSTDFSFTRFLVPHLAGFSGPALFIDCDMLFRADIAELWKLRDDTKAAQVVKHDYAPQEETKFLGQAQVSYPRKNWSSVMLFNAERCRALTPTYVSAAEPASLHQFKWLADDMIGELPQQWNHLVGVHDYNPEAKLVHWTIGGPYFDEYKNADYADEWFREHRLMNHAEQASA